jgi:hypothetical protein
MHDLWLRFLETTYAQAKALPFDLELGESLIAHKFDQIFYLLQIHPCLLNLASGICCNILR